MANTLATPVLYHSHRSIRRRGLVRLIYMPFDCSWWPTWEYHGSVRRYENAPCGCVDRRPFRQWPSVTQSDPARDAPDLLRSEDVKRHGSQSTMCHHFAIHPLGNVSR